MGKTNGILNGDLYCISNMLYRGRDDSIQFYTGSALKDLHLKPVKITVSYCEGPTVEFPIVPQCSPNTLFSCSPNTSVDHQGRTNGV